MDTDDTSWHTDPERPPLAPNITTRGEHALVAACCVAMGLLYTSVIIGLLRGMGVL